MFTRLGNFDERRGGRIISWAPQRAALRHRSDRLVQRHELVHVEGHNLDHKPNPEVAPDIRSALDEACKGARPSVVPGQPVPPYVLEAFATLLIADDARAAEEFLRDVVPRDMGTAELSDRILRDTLGRLGDRWSADQMSFVDMSVAVARVKGLGRSFASTRAICSTAVSKGRALFATLMNQSHGLGLSLAAQAFRETGWDVDLHLNEAPDRVVQSVKTTRPWVVGLTVGSRRDVSVVHKTILKLRALPFRCKVLVGGNAAHLLAGKSNSFLVDALVPDIATALAHAED
ncbi:cobalamin B12-binding domain-containing protein [Tropicimonas sp. S265A]|uniref:cobalamin B12-binding domain-containing protein n=1 Tax=Tropicimonas sp. S265A TaxID=3415134 RepID=UPI003C7CE816